jgi:hypothetical protein
MKAKISQRQLAKLLDESQPAIAKHVRMGHVKLSGDLLDAVVQLYKHTREVAAGRQPEDRSVDRMLEAALLDRAKRAEIETRLAIQRGELLPVQMFVDGTAAAFSACKAKFLAGPSKIRTQFPDLASEVFTAMEQHAYDVLSELSSDGFARDIRKRLEAELARVQAGTAAKRKRMGRHKQKIKQCIKPRSRTVAHP